MNKIKNTSKGPEIRSNLLHQIFIFCPKTMKQSQTLRKLATFLIITSVQLSLKESKSVGPNSFPTEIHLIVND